MGPKYNKIIEDSPAQSIQSGASGDVRGRPQKGVLLSMVEAHSFASGQTHFRAPAPRRNSQNGKPKRSDSVALTGNRLSEYSDHHDRRKLIQDLLTEHCRDDGAVREKSRHSFDSGDDTIDSIGDTVSEHMDSSARRNFPIAVDRRREDHFAPSMSSDRDRADVPSKEEDSDYEQESEPRSDAFSDEETSLHDLPSGSDTDSLEPPPEDESHNKLESVSVSDVESVVVSSEEESEFDQELLPGGSDVESVTVSNEDTARQEDVSGAGSDVESVAVSNEDMPHLEDDSEAGGDVESVVVSDEEMPHLTADSEPGSDVESVAVSNEEMPRDEFDSEIGSDVESVAVSNEEMPRHEDYSEAGSDVESVVVSDEEMPRHEDYSETGSDVESVAVSDEEMPRHEDYSETGSDVESVAVSNEEMPRHEEDSETGSHVESVAVSDEEMPRNEEDSETGSYAERVAVSNEEMPLHEKDSETGSDVESVAVSDEEMSLHESLRGSILQQSDSADSADPRFSREATSKSSRIAEPTANIEDNVGLTTNDSIRESSIGSLREPPDISERNIQGKNSNLAESSTPTSETSDANSFGSSASPEHVYLGEKVKSTAHKSGGLKAKGNIAPSNWDESVNDDSPQPAQRGKSRKSKTVASAPKVGIQKAEDVESGQPEQSKRKGKSTPTNQSESVDTDSSRPGRKGKKASTPQVDTQNQIRTVRKISLGKDGPQVQRTTRKVSTSKRKSKRSQHKLNEDEAEHDSSTQVASGQSWPSAAESLTLPKNSVNDNDSNSNQYSSIPSNGKNNKKKKGKGRRKVKSTEEVNEKQNVDPEQSDGSLRSHGEFLDAESQMEDIEADMDDQGRPVYPDKWDDRDDRSQLQDRPLDHPPESENKFGKSRFFGFTKAERKARKAQKELGDNSGPSLDSEDQEAGQRKLRGRSNSSGSLASFASRSSIDSAERTARASGRSFMGILSRGRSNRNDMDGTTHSRGSAQAFAGREHPKAHNDDDRHTLDSQPDAPDRMRNRVNSSGSLASLRSRSSMDSVDGTAKTSGRSFMGLRPFGRSTSKDNIHNVGSTKEITESSPNKQKNATWLSWPKSKNKKNGFSSPHKLKNAALNDLENETSPARPPGLKSRRPNEDNEHPKTVSEQREERTRLYLLDQQRRKSMTIQSALRGYMVRKSLGIVLPKNRYVVEESSSEEEDEVFVDASNIQSPDGDTLATPSSSGPAGLALRSRAGDKLEEPSTVAEKPTITVSYPKSPSIHGGQNRDQNSVDSRATTLPLNPPTNEKKGILWLPFLKPKKVNPRSNPKDASNVQSFNTSLYIRERMYKDEQEAQTKTQDEVRNDRLRMYFLDLQRREAIKIQAATRGFLTRKELFPLRYKQHDKKDQVVALSRGSETNKKHEGMPASQREGNQSAVAGVDVGPFDRSSYLIDRLQRDEDERQTRTVAEIRQERHEIYMRDLQRREAVKIQAAMRGFMTRKRYPGYGHASRVSSRDVNKREDRPVKSKRGWGKIKQFLVGASNDAGHKDQEDDNDFEKFDPYADALSADFLGLKEAKRNHRTGFFELEKTQDRSVQLNAYTESGRHWNGRKQRKPSVGLDTSTSMSEQKARDELKMKIAIMADKRAARRAADERDLELRSAVTTQTSAHGDILKKGQTKAKQVHQKRTRKATGARTTPSDNGTLNSKNADRNESKAKNVRSPQIRSPSTGKTQVTDEGIVESKPVQSVVLSEYRKEKRHSGLTHSTDIGTSYWLPQASMEVARSYREADYVPDDSYKKYYQQKPVKVTTSSYWECVRSEYIPRLGTSTDGNDAGLTIPVIPSMKSAVDSSNGNTKSVVEDDCWLPPGDPKASISIPSGSDNDPSDDSWVPLPSRRPHAKPRRLDFAGNLSEPKEESWAPHLPSPSKRQKPSIIITTDLTKSSSGPPNKSFVEVPMGDAHLSIVSPETKDHRRTLLVLCAILVLLSGAGVACAYFFWDDAPWK